MREIYDFRIPEERAAAVLAPDDGVVLGGTVRKVEVAGDSPLFDTIRAAHQAARARDGFFYASWQVRRRFSAAELGAASLFRLIHTGFTEQAGEPAGDGIALDTRRLPKKELVVTLAGERLASQRLASLILDAGLTGMELRPVRHGERSGEQSIDLARVPAGRRLLEAGAAAGYPHPGWGFWVWLGRPEQEALLADATGQHWDATRGARARRKAAAPRWYQLVVVSPPVPTVLPTRFGIGPFDDDPAGEFRDPAARIAGLNILSPCHVAADAWDASDFAETRERIGREAGLLRPTPLLLVSPRVRELFDEHDVKGASFEVAHLVRGGEPVLP